MSRKEKLKKSPTPPEKLQVATNRIITGPVLSALLKKRLKKYKNTSPNARQKFPVARYYLN